MSHSRAILLESMQLQCTMMEQCVSKFKTVVLLSALLSFITPTVCAEEYSKFIEVRAKERLEAILSGDIEVKHYLNLESYAAGVAMQARRDADTITLSFTSSTYVRSYKLKGHEITQFIDYLGAYEEIINHDDPITEVSKRYPSLAGIVYPFDHSNDGAEITVISWQRDTIHGNLMALGNDAMVLSHHKGGLRQRDTLIVLPYSRVRLVSDAKHEAEDMYLATMESNAEQVVNAVAAYLQARPVYESFMPPEVRALIDQPYQFNLDELAPDPVLSLPMYGIRLSILGHFGLALGNFEVRAHDSLDKGQNQTQSREYSFGSESVFTPYFGASITAAMAISHSFDLCLQAGIGKYFTSTNDESWYSRDANSIGGRFAIAYNYGRPDYSGYLNGGGLIGAGIGVLYTNTHVQTLLSAIDGDYSRLVITNAESVSPLISLMARDQLRLTGSLFLLGEISASYIWPTSITSEIRYSEADIEHILTSTFLTPAQFMINLGIGLEYVF